MKIVDFPKAEEKEICPDPIDIAHAKEFLSEVELGRVTHGILCYRKSNGDLNWKIFNTDHLTYIIGMMERVKFDLQRDLAE